MNIASSNPFKKYSYLSENLVESENYEIQKLINGPIDGVFYIRENDTVLVQAGEYLWKINKNGHLVDTLERPRGIYSSGIYFKEDYYIDWVYSGNKSKQKYSKIINANDMSEIELTKYLDSADIVEFNTSWKNDKVGRCYLKIKDRGIAMDITNLYDRIDTRCRSRDIYEKIGWQDTGLDGYKKKHKDKLIVLENSLSQFRDWEDKNSPLFIQKFVRKFYFFENGIRIWLFGATYGKYLKSKGMPGALPKAYWLGTGFFQLKHNSELLNFKAFVSNKDGRLNFNNISLYGFPEHHKGDMRIIEIAYRHNNYLESEQKLNKHYEKEVGLYVLRKKISHTQGTTGGPGKKSISSGQRSSYRTRNPWQPMFTGMKPSSSIWGNINFYNNEHGYHHYLLDAAAVQTGLHAIPQKLSFSWKGKIKPIAFKLWLNEKEFAWYHPHERDSSVFLELHFDEAEIVDAFQRLDSINQPLQLEMRMGKRDKLSASLSIRLCNNKESIPLENTKFISIEPGYDKNKKKLTLKFEKSKLQMEFRNALKNKSSIQDFMNLSQKIAANSPYIKEYSLELSYYATKLLVDRIKNADYKLAEKIVYHFVDKLLPYTGMHENSLDLAGNVFPASYPFPNLPILISPN